MTESDANYFHFCNTPLEVGAVINPGGRGHVLRRYEWQHNNAITEMALEESRINKFSHLPSRLAAIFVFLTIKDALLFRSRQGVAFNAHFLYRISLSNVNAPRHIADWRLIVPSGRLRSNWADAYWLPLDVSSLDPEINSSAFDPHIGQLREMLTLSPIRVVECLP